MEGMFFKAGDFNQDISGWQTGQVKLMKRMFAGAVDFKQDLHSWQVGQVTDATQFCTLSDMQPAEVPFADQDCRL